MGKQVTVIIPTYNMEGFLANCLDSLTIPDFDKVEVIVVNDGSKDRSSEIAHSYADRYPDSIRVIDKPNGNYGSCINAALPQATGRYLKVLDADDTFDKESFSSFVNALADANEDVIITNHVIVDPDGKEIGKSDLPKEMPLGTTLAKGDYPGFFSGYIQMHRLAYRREVFSRFRYTQTEGVSYSDSQWAIIPMSFCHSFRCFDMNLYKYLIGRQGQTMDSEQLGRCLDNFFTVLCDTCKYFDCEGISPQNRENLLHNITEVHDFVYRKAISNPTEYAMAELHKYDVALRDVSQAIYKSVGDIRWTEEVPFKMVEDIRAKKYPVGYRIPFIARLQLSVKLKVSRLKSTKL